MRLYAGLYPLGAWSDPCEVICTCGYRERAVTCGDAQRLAWLHDETHWNGTAAQQLELFTR